MNEQQYTVADVQMPSCPQTKGQNPADFHSGKTSTPLALQ